MHIRKGDQVAVLSGKDRGKKGKVLVVLRDEKKAIVEGVNMIKKHVRADPRKGVQGGVLEREAPVHVSNLAPIDPESGKPTRVGHKFLEGSSGKGRKVRVSRRSGAELDR
jgi:large subunit ribosomal protein L24